MRSIRELLFRPLVFLADVRSFGPPFAVLRMTILQFGFAENGELAAEN